MKIFLLLAEHLCSERSLEQTQNKVSKLPLATEKDEL